MTEYPTPYTWTAQEVPTADLMNANVRDPQTWLMGMPAYYGYKSAAQQTFPTNAFTPVVMDVDDLARGFTHTLGASEVYVDQDGWYRLAANVLLSHVTTGAVGRRAVAFKVNNTTWTGNGASLGNAGVAAGYFFIASRNVFYYLSAGDYVQMMVFQSGGSASDCKTYAAAAYTNFSIIWQGRDYS